MFVLRLFLLLAICILSTANSFSQGTWTQKADFGGTARYGVEGFAISNKIYIGTGLGTTGHKNDFWEYDVSTEIWTQKANFTGGARELGTGFSIGTKGYFGVGIQGPSQWYNDFWEFDPSINTWTPKANFGGLARWCAVGFSIGTKGYIGTGIISNNPQDVLTSDFWEWDQNTNTWTQKASFSGGARLTAVGFSIGTLGYIGTASGNTPEDFWEWDQTTNVWTQKASFMGGARSGAVGFSIGTKGYVGTGDSISNTSKKDFWEWDQGTNIWTQKANFGGTARSHAIGLSIGGKGYIGAGIDSSGVQRDFWEFDPSGNGINELQTPLSFSMYPNPFSTQTTFTFSDYIKDASLKIYSVSGKEERNISFSGRQLVLERGVLASGVYFYCLTPQGEGRKGVTGKVIIQ